MRAIGSRAVSSSVLLRLARLPGEAAAVARAVAVLGEGADLPAVAGVAGLDEALVAGTMAALARAEILRPEPPPGFVHPLVRDAVYTGLPLGERELLHARAAGVLCAGGASLDQIAGQLMLTPRRGDAAVARLLHEAGNAALARGAVDSSVGYLQRALEEPPAPEIRPQLLLDLGEVEALTRGPTGAHAPARGLRGPVRRRPAHPRRQRARPRAAVHLLARRRRRGGPRGRRDAAARAGRRGARPARPSR